jgi:hypothetical protein
MAEMTSETSNETEDLTELDFSPLAPEEAEALEDRVYLLGVHADGVRAL